MLDVDLHIEDVPRIFDRFCRLIGERSWLRRVLAIKREIQGHKFLSEYLTSENDVAFALARCSDLRRRYNTLPAQEIDDELYPALSLAAQIVSIIDKLDRNQQNKLIRRLHGAFNNPDDMRAIQLELLAATHFARRGFSISFPEMNSIETYDVLVNELGDSGLEIECKLVTRDKGRKIHRRDALEFFNVVRDIFSPIQNRLESGLAVVITVSGRLPNHYKEKKRLARWALERVMENGGTTEDDSKSVRVIDFPAETLNRAVLLGNDDTRRDEVDRVTSTTNREVMLMGNTKGGVLAVVVQSSQDDSLMEYTFETLGRAAKSQLSKKRPAMLIVGFHSVDAADLVEIAKKDAKPGNGPTALRINASKFLSSADRRHIVAACFLSRSSLEPFVAGTSNSGGSAYIFHNDESEFWKEDFRGLFQ